MNIGWKVVVETTNGIVGLCTSPVGKWLRLYYPLGVEIPDELVMNILDVTYGEPVADKEYGTRLWAKYYSKPFDQGGRVWIEQSNDVNDSSYLGTIVGMHLVEHCCGYQETNTIYNYKLSYCSKEQPEAPTTDPEIINQFTEKFVKLLIEVAKCVGEIEAVTFESGLEFYTPEMLEENGYEVSRWHEEHMGYCYASDKNFEFLLKSGNSLVAWKTYIRFLANNELTAEDLLKFIDQLEGTKIVNLKPIFEVCLKKAM